MNSKYASNDERAERAPFPSAWQTRLKQAGRLAVRPEPPWCTLQNQAALRKLGSSNPKAAGRAVYKALRLVATPVLFPVNACHMRGLESQTSCVDPCGNMLCCTKPCINQELERLIGRKTAPSWKVEATETIFVPRSHCLRCAHHQRKTKFTGCRATCQDPQP